MPVRAAIYCRISNDPSGRAAGVRRQEKECRELAERRGWDVVATHTDNDVAANAKRRPAFDALREGLEQGEYDAVIAWKDDRLLRGGRSKRAHEFLTLVRDRRITCAFVQGDDWDFSTAQGRLMVEIRLGIAGYEIEQASERQLARWRQRKENGREANLGRRPFGFDRVGGEGARHLEVNPAEAEAIRDAARKLIAGESLYRVTREMPVPTPYGKGWRPSHLRRMFTGTLFARHGILTADEDRLVKARFEAIPKTGRGRPRRTYALAGLAVCGICGTKLSAGSGSFRCQPPGCGRVGVKADLLDRTVGEQLVEHLPPEKDRGEPPKPSENEAALLRELADIEARIEALTDDLELDERVLARRTKALVAKRDQLTGKLGRPRTTPRIAWDWIAKWAASGDLQLTADDREFLAEVIRKVTVQPARVRGAKFDPSRIKITWRKHERPELNPP